MNGLQPPNYFLEVLYNADGRTTVYRFGDMALQQPIEMDGRFEYTYMDSNGVTTNVSLTENTIGAAMDAMAIQENWENSRMSYVWHTPNDVTRYPDAPVDPQYTQEHIMQITVNASDVVRRWGPRIRNRTRRCIRLTLDVDVNDRPITQ
jgi:hypothetical protein